MGLFKDFKKALQEQLSAMAGNHPQPAKRSPAKQSTKRSAAKKPPAPVVRVAYLNEYTGPAIPTREAQGGFHYYWRVSTPPKLGQHVLAPVNSGYWEEAIVIGFGRDGFSGRLKSITRTVK